MSVALALAPWLAAAEIAAVVVVGVVIHRRRHPRGTYRA